MSATAEPPAPGRLRRDAEVNRRRILDAAGSLMAERGLGVALEDIAAAAGVGTGTMYRRFPTRDALIVAVFAERVKAFVADLEASFEIEDGWHAMVWFLTQATTRRVADRALSELLQQDSVVAGLDGLRATVMPLTERVVARAHATGRLRSDFTAADLIVVQNLLSAVGGVDGLWRRYLGMVLDGVVASRSGFTALPVESPTDEDLTSLFAHPRPQTPDQ